MYKLTQGILSGRFCLKEFCAIIFHPFKSKEVNKYGGGGTKLAKQKDLFKIFLGKTWSFTTKGALLE